MISHLILLISDLEFFDNFYSPQKAIWFELYGAALFGLFFTNK